PRHLLNALVLLEPFARRDHHHLALGVAHRRSGLVEHRLRRQAGIYASVRPEFLTGHVDAQTRRRVGAKVRERMFEAMLRLPRIRLGRRSRHLLNVVVEIAHTRLSSTTSLKSQPACFGTSGTTLRPIAPQTCRQRSAAFWPSPFSSWSTRRWSRGP